MELKDYKLVCVFITALFIFKKNRAVVISIINMNGKRDV